MLTKCVHCGQEPKVIHLDVDMWYVECQCNKHPKYEFFGYTRDIAVDRWEYANRPINRVQPKRKEKKNEGKNRKKNANRYTK